MVIAHIGSKNFFSCFAAMPLHLYFCLFGSLIFINFVHISLLAQINYVLKSEHG